LFPKLDGGSLSLQGWASTFHRAAERAGIGRVFVPNDLRRTAASWNIGECQASVYDVQNMLGHAQPSITLNIYGEFWQKGAERLAEQQDAKLRADTPPASDAAVVSIR
jgi:integrase